MNFGQIYKKTVTEWYGQSGVATDVDTASTLFTPSMVASFINEALNEYWGIFNDNEWSYYSIREQVLNVTAATNIYTLPNGDPAQVETLTFSAIPTSGGFTYGWTQNSVAKTTSSITTFTATAIQTAINAQAAAQCTVLGPVNSVFTILWDTTSVTLPISAITIGSNTTGSTITDVTTAANVNNLNIATVTNMRIRMGSTPSTYQYSLVSPIFPSDKYESFLPQTYLNNITNSGPTVAWCFDSGTQDGNGYPQWNVRFVPFPQNTYTMVYDGTRYNAEIAVGSTGSVTTTQIPDLPIHMHMGICHRVYKNMLRRVKADLTEVNKEIELFDQTQFKVLDRAVQRQGSLSIKRVVGGR